MYKWTRLKLAVLTATATLSALALGSCLAGNAWERVVQYVIIGNLFD